MKKSSVVLLLIMCTLVMVAQQKPAAKTKPVKQIDTTQQLSRGKVFGAVISDINYVVQEASPAPNQAKTTGGRNSFDTRRVHLGYHHTFSKDLSARVIYDPAVGSLQEAYLNWENAFPMHSVMIGMMHTPAERTTEKFFGYRSLGMLVLDRKGYSQEFDRGINITGNLDPQGSLYYSLGAVNGSGLALESDKLKKYIFTFGLMPDKGSVAELYLDYENFSAGRSVITAKFLYAMMTPTYAFGLDAFYRMNRKFAVTKDIVPAGGSLFGWMEIMQATRAVVRMDVIDDDLNNAGAVAANPSYREIYLNIGLDYLPAADVHIIPNIAYVKWMQKDKSPVIHDYLLARLTAAIYFK
jgi:hypothetical protein